MKKISLIGLILACLFMGCTVDPANTIILPKDFVGTVIIFYDTESQIHQSGELMIPEVKEHLAAIKVEGMLNPNWKKPDNVFYEKQSEQTKIPKGYKIEDYSETEASISISSTGVLTTSEGNKIDFQQFHVGTKGQILEQMENFDRNVDLDSLYLTFD